MSAQQMLLDSNAASTVQIDVQYTCLCTLQLDQQTSCFVHTIKDEYRNGVMRAHSYIASCAVSAVMKRTYRIGAGYQRFLADSTCSLSGLWLTPVQIARAFRRKKMMAEVMGGGKSRQQLLNRHADRSVPLPITSMLTW